ncbi:MAG: hypothetical protein ACLFSQ_00890 [Candidatus Zixiibacteriota bacterium]
MNLTESLEEILAKQRKSIIQGDIKELDELTNRAQKIVEKLRKSGGIKTKSEAEKLSDELSKNIDILQFAQKLTHGLLESIQTENIIKKTGTIRKRA